MKPSSDQLTVRILDREYRLACASDEQAVLMAAVADVDARMTSIRDQGKIVSGERIAVYAALSIANDLLAARDKNRPSPPHESNGTAGQVAVRASNDIANDEFARRIRAINALLDDVLDPLQASSVSVEGGR